MAMGFPLLAQELKRAPGQRHVTVVVALAGADVQEHALGIDVADLQPKPFTQTQAAGVNRNDAVNVDLILTQRRGERGETQSLADESGFTIWCG